MPDPGHSTESILESISDGVFTVDEQWRVTSFNRAAEVITGIPRTEALGRRCSEVFRSSLCEIACPLHQTLDDGHAVIDMPCWFVDATGQRIAISISTAVLRDADGRVIGGAETFRDLREIEDLRAAVAERFRIGELVSCSPAMRPILQLLPAVAASTSTVLINGETGTGKELVARAIHAAGPRAAGPFVAVNCGALPDGLLESELFGHVRGAFTGAHRDRPGRFVQADGGTLLLDEIGEISPALQVRLLRVLQERVVEAVGSDHSRRVDVRVLAATHRDLHQLMASERLREDLYYRINVLRLDLPPLRERRADIPLLAEAFIARFNQAQGRDIVGLSSQALHALMQHRWPGNVRELENVIERAYLLCPGPQIQVGHLPPELARPDPRPGPAANALRGTRQAAEADSIRAALEHHQGNRRAAAQALGIHPSTLFRRMRSLGISAPARDGRQR